MIFLWFRLQAKRHAAFFHFAWNVHNNVSVIFYCCSSCMSFVDNKNSPFSGSHLHRTAPVTIGRWLSSTPVENSIFVWADHESSLTLIPISLIFDSETLHEFWEPADTTETYPLRKTGFFETGTNATSIPGTFFLHSFLPGVLNSIGKIVNRHLVFTAGWSFQGCLPWLASSCIATIFMST